MLDALISPWAALGAVAGLAVAGAIHWMAPTDVDMSGLAAWLVGIGFICGLGWELLRASKK